MRASLDDALRALGSGAIASVHAVGGGCISETARLHTTDGARYFLKWAGPSLPRGLFDAEADGLRALGDTGALRVPRVVALRDEAGDAAPRWLLLEWLEPGRATTATWTALGRALAAVHRVRAGRPGWPRDNFIGALPQANARLGSWPAFWRERRLEPQLRRAFDGGGIETADVLRFESLFAALDELLAPAAEDGWSVLHGDLWSGNLLVCADGEPALVDPSTYNGHREVDLAMARLFGGFDAAFHDAYEEAWPLLPGSARRQAVYQLYYLLVHVNLFGGGYRAGTLGALRAAGF